MARPDPKLTIARRHAEAGDWVACLRVVARFPQLGEHGAAIQQGWNAHLRPAFYRELGRDPDALWAAAVRAVCARYGWPVPPEFSRGGK